MSASTTPTPRRVRPAARRHTPGRSARRRIPCRPVPDGPGRNARRGRSSCGGAAAPPGTGAWCAPTGSLARGWVRLLRDDAGMSTVEYAIGCVAAAAFAAVLYGVVSGESVVTALTQLVQRALSTEF